MTLLVLEAAIEVEYFPGSRERGLEIGEDALFEFYEACFDQGIVVKVVA